MYRILNLPWITGGYARYEWWSYNKVPEFLMAIAYNPVIGASFSPMNKLEEHLVGSLDKKNFQRALFYMKLLNIRYVVIHTDYIPIKNEFEPSKKMGSHLSLFQSNKDLNPTMDNQFFRLYDVAPLQTVEKPSEK